MKKQTKKTRRMAGILQRGGLEKTEVDPGNQQVHRL